MSASEVGKTSTKVKESLEQVLELTSKWNAILLLDVCDMFLEARSTADIRRNRLVSGDFRAAPSAVKCYCPAKVNPFTSLSISEAA